MYRTTHNRRSIRKKAVIDSGCSRHITGNKCYLDEYEDYDGGFVSFGDGKGIIFVKNNVLFTNTECLVLSSDFKLLDESQVLLRVPRKDNIYSVDLKNVVPTGDLTCLFAKTTIDESNTWHRRLGHINFKTMNKLVNGNLVKGLPSKNFKNDHSCVACQKGNQHKASYKTNLVNSINKPLHMLHMDLFGPTNVKSLMRKSYCLVVTDDFSRFSWFCEMKRIKREFSVARTPQQNVNTACYVLNRVLVIKPHNKTPYELIHGRPPLIYFMKPFGCPVTILNTRDHLGKFDGKADEGYFIRYFVDSKAMRVFNKRTRIVEETLNIRFLENSPNVKGNGTKDNTIAGQAQKEKEHAQEYILIPIFTIEPSISQGGKDDKATRSESERLNQREMQTENTNNTNDINTVSTPVNTARPSGGTANEEHLFERFSPFRIAFSLPPVPNISSTDNTGIFGNAYDDEEEVDMNNVNSSYSVPNTSFTKFHKDHPEDQVIGSLKTPEPKKVLQALEDPSWVEAMKNELLQFKLLNVWTLIDLPRDKWAIGIDYDEIFAPVARIESIRLFLAYASFKDFVVYQMDVKSAFLYGKIEEEVYVDDIIFGSTKKEMSIEFEKLMHDKFQMSSIGELSFFLGLQVKQKSDGIFISQDKYVAEILKKFDFASIKTASTPMETNKPLTKDEEAEDVDVHLYRSMIGSLMYLTASRPDIMFAVYACARFQVTPKTSHLHAVKRIFRYLKGQPKLGLWYPRDSPFDLEAFSDSDYAGASLDRKSTTGGCQFLGKRLISWQCKKQTIVANSTTEAEYVAAANCCGQVLWIQNQMLDYGYNLMNTNIYIDNESTICIVKNPVSHSKTKHIEIRYHFIRDSYEKKLIQVIKIHTDKNVADLLTKAFDVSRFNFLIASIGLLNL
ncbi:putative ribonuclease H-like domain-containing protein [Tanacetum coccineum]